MQLNAAPVPPPRRSVPLALFAVAILIVAGVAIVATAAYFELRPSGSPAPGAVVITDDLGRRVTVPPDPARVVVLAPSIMDSMVRLGLRGHVVGVDCGTPAAGGLTTDYNASQIAAWNLSTGLCVETSPSVDIPQVLNDSPQLVLASTIISVSDVEEMSSTYHLPVLLLQPATLGGIAVDVTLLGQVFGVTSAAQQLVAQLQVALGTASATVANLSSAGTPLHTVLLTYYASPAGSPAPGYWTYGPSTFGQSLIEFVGAASISANSTLPYPELSGDQVLAANPWGIIYGTGFGVTLATYQGGPEWSSLGAVQQNHVWGLDSNLLTEPDPTMVLVGVPALLALVNPPGSTG
jgi:iron complex transport system substrate-binding protein